MERRRRQPRLQLGDGRLRGTEIEVRARQPDLAARLLEAGFADDRVEQGHIG